MIAYLKGTIIQKSSNQVILDIGGVGYCCWVPLSTYFHLGDINQLAELFIYTHVTDSSLNLYGFSTEGEKELFLKLISISGIGPKIALNILSGIETADLEDAIRKSDVARLSLIPGVGKKTAMRIALELQEKLEEKEKIVSPAGLKEKEDLVSALMNLGFKRKEVEQVVEKTVKDLSQKTEFDILLKECLKRMAKI